MNKKIVEAVSGTLNEKTSSLSPKSKIKNLKILKKIRKGKMEDACPNFFPLKILWKERKKGIWEGMKE